jgi:glycosyltransferase involved in cell wall biosynthesis
MKKIVVITDFDMGGSGYRNLTIPLLEGLSEMGYEIKVAGLGYKGEEHLWDFSLIPAKDMNDTIAITKNLEQLWGFDVLLVLLDIPLQQGLLGQFPERKFKYVGVFPIEAPPLCMTWAMVLSQMDKALVISEFGANEAQKKGIDAEHIQIGIDIGTWKAPEPEEREKLRSVFGVDDDTHVILTVADNQERKHLSRAMEVVADFTYDHYPVSQKVIDEKELEPKHKVQYIIVTREHFWGGWKLRDYAQELGINLQLTIIERGVPFQELWGLYAMADAFLLTSKAEGLGMPILEAMAMKVPVLATGATAMQELLGDGERGISIPYWKFPAFDDYTDPFGNGLRYFAKREDGYIALRQGLTSGFQECVQNAYKYVSKRTHHISVDQLHNVLKEF